MRLAVLSVVCECVEACAWAIGVDGVVLERLVFVTAEVGSSVFLDRGDVCPTSFVMSGVAGVLVFVSAVVSEAFGGAWDVWSYTIVYGRHEAYSNGVCAGEDHPGFGRMVHEKCSCIHIHDAIVSSCLGVNDAMTSSGEGRRCSLTMRMTTCGSHGDWSVVSVCSEAAMDVGE